MRTPEPEYESLRRAYVRLRLAAQKVVEAADYATGSGDEPRVYASQLRDLEHELAGEPQPSGLSWMGVS